MKKEDYLNFVLACDENYVDKLAVVILSILEAHPNDELINLHILSNNISKISLKKIESLGTDYCNFSIYNLDNLKELLGKEVNVDHLSLAAYARLFIPNLLPNELKKVIYLDVDIIVKNDLKDLYFTDMKGKYIGGVRSLSDLDKSGDDSLFHINSGVILWNLEECRKDRLFEKFLEYIKNEEGHIKFHDQTVINACCKGKIMELHPKYNVMSGMLFLKYSKFIEAYGLKNYYTKNEYEVAVSDPYIIHLTSWVVGRPWEKKCVHPYKSEYLGILDKTPWRGIALVDNKHSKLNFLKRSIYKVLPGYSIKFATQLKRKLKSN
ncbi:glycosyltransferase family 8 protein [Paenibacillus sp. RS8]|uniref:glycosyltransferase family 8 protein n=1 Tax=Paenibacillus sp. RS8 TaxID=3242681 RepID=UPI0035C00C82